MNIEFVGKNGFQVKKEYEDYMIKKLSKVDKFIDSSYQVRVVFKEYPNYNKVEVTIPMKNLILRAEVKEREINECIDLVVDKLVSQIKKYQKRVNKKIDKEGIKEAYKSDFDLEALEKEVLAKQIVKNKEIKLTELTKEEALNQMELLGHTFYIFKDIETKKISVCYLREDGDYTIIETN